MVRIRIKGFISGYSKLRTLNYTWKSKGQHHPANQGCDDLPIQIKFLAHHHGRNSKGNSTQHPCHDIREKRSKEMPESCTVYLGQLRGSFTSFDGCRLNPIIIAVFFVCIWPPASLELVWAERRQCHGPVLQSPHLCQYLNWIENILDEKAGRSCRS